MCFPECDVPRNVLLVNFSEDEIEKIATSALEKFHQKWNNAVNFLEVNSDLLKLNKEDLNTIKSITDSEENNYVFCKQYLQETIYEIYNLLRKLELEVKNSEKYSYIGKLLTGISQVYECIDLYLLWNLFNITKCSESMDYIPLKASQIFKLYAFCCETAIKKNLIIDPKDKELFENARDFFEDIAQWVSHEMDRSYTDIIKISSYQKYEEIIKTIKKAMKNETFQYRE